MTVTDTPPEAVSPPTEASSAPSVPTVAPGGLAATIGSGDHKVVGRLYIGFSLVFLLVSLVAGLLVSIDRIDGTLGDTILDTDTYNQVFTFAATSLVFLFLLPAMIGLAMCVVPLQVGANSIAFPRAAAASFWGWLVGSGMVIAAYAMNGGPGGGRFDGVALWATALALVAASLTLGAVCLATTVLALRAPGMRLERTPFFSWSVLASATVWILSLPVLIGTLVLIYVDHRYGQRSFGVNGEVMYGRVVWAVHQPQLYAFAAPALGLIADVVPVAARNRQPQRRLVMGAIAAFAVLGFGAFIQTTVYPDTLSQPVYKAMAFLAVLPVLALLGGWASTFKGGRPRISSPLLFAVASLLMLLAAVLLGAISAVNRFDLTGTLFDEAQAHATIMAATIGVFGGFWYWATKIVGHPIPEAAGRLVALVLLVGAALFALPDAISGAFGDGGEATTGIEGLNVVSTVGLGVVILATLLTVLALLGSLRGEGDVPADPWGGHTLEWTTASPPAPGNFAELPSVTSAEPVLAAADATSTEEGSA